MKVDDHEERYLALLYTIYAYDYVVAGVWRIYAGTLSTIQKQQHNIIQGDLALRRGRDYSLALGCSSLSMASATRRRWIFPVAVLGLDGAVSACLIRDKYKSSNVHDIGEEDLVELG
jgi:hypothetical protein